MDGVGASLRGDGPQSEDRREVERVPDASGFVEDVVLPQAAEGGLLYAKRGAEPAPTDRPVVVGGLLGDQQVGGWPCHQLCSVRRGRAPTTHPDVLGRVRRRGHDPQTQRWRGPENSRNSPAVRWGAYLPAIRRWEQVTERAAPRTTAPDARRRSADFVGWMKGLGEGWVTAVRGLSRAAQLRLPGKSVVPRQAAHTLEILLCGGRHRGAAPGSDLTLSGDR